MKSGHNMQIVWTALAAGALSAGVALLYAPQSGARTRRMVSRKAEDTGQIVRKAYERVKDSGNGAARKLYRLRIGLTPRLVAKRFARA